MKLLGAVLIVLAVEALAGCVVVPEHRPVYYEGGHGAWHGFTRD
jgi:hypothetical protein